MTIITKPVTEKKFDKQDQPLVQNEFNESLPLPLKKDVENDLPPPAYLALHARARRVSTATTVCVFVTALLVLTIGIIGGVYLYQQFARTKMQRFRAWCEVPSNGNPEMFTGHFRGQASSLVDFQDSSSEDSSEMSPSRNSFKENVEIDTYEQKYEKIDVPDFSGSRHGRFIHDFTANKTGIIDLEGNRCFVMPLNRSRVLPPNSLYDLVVKMRAGYYEVDTEVVRETMRVVRPQIKDFSTMGYYIARECSSMPTYKLERMTKPIVKRSADSENAVPLVFSVFSGIKTSQYNIIMDEN